MRILEIILKLAFLALSVSLIITQNIFSPYFDLLLVICITLGLILILNRHSSYKFKHTKTDFTLRHIEGAILVIFAAISSSIGL